MPVMAERESEQMSCHGNSPQVTSPKKSSFDTTTTSSADCIKESIKDCIKDDEEDSTGCQRSPTDLSMSHEPSVCAGCGTVIQDRYVLLALDRRWHSQCLKCSECCTSLDSAISCFTRDGKIYCKSDYYKMFVKRCTRCGQSIYATDLVMRARENVYHLSCFTCAWCNVPMARGDIFGIAGNLVYCRTHYELRRSVSGHSPLTPMSHLPQIDPAIDGQLSPPPPNLFHDLIQPGHFSSFPFHSHSIHSRNAAGILDTLANVSNGPSNSKGRKGRPRKRKNVPQSSNNQSSCPDTSRTSTHEVPGHEPMTVGADGEQSRTLTNGESHPSFNGTHSPSLIHSLDGTSFDTSTNIPDHNLLDSNSNGGHSSIGSGRTKRMRTSFKHHQLRTMKQYFAINQNPDAKDLKQLAQKTSLSKRVLQVWFQNARAKWRRNNLKGGGNGQFQMDMTNSSNSGIHLPPISSLNHSNQSNESNSQPLPSMTPGHLLGQNSGPGSVGQISSSISILNPETPNTSTGLPSPGGSSCGRGHFSAPSPTPSLTGSATGNFLSELTGIGRHHGYEHDHGHNVHDSGHGRESGHGHSSGHNRESGHGREPGSNGSNSPGFKPDGFKKSPDGQHSPSPPMSAFPTHLSIAQIHSHFRTHPLIHGHQCPISSSPRAMIPQSPESRFQELY